MRVKVCAKCRQELPLGEFHKHTKMRDGLRSRCRECRSQQNQKYYIIGMRRRYYEQNRDKILQQQKGYKKKYLNTIRGHLRHVFNNINQRCNNLNCEAFKNYGNRGIQNKFQSSDEFLDYVINELRIDPRGLHIDRINNDGHYETGNIRFVTRKENMDNRRNNMKGIRNGKGNTTTSISE